MDKLSQRIKELFHTGAITLAIGYENGPRGPRPFFCRREEDVERMVFSNDIPHNLAVYLTKPELVKGEKVAVAATVSTLRSIYYLFRENQVGQTAFTVLHLSSNDEFMHFLKTDDIAVYIDHIPSEPSARDRELMERLDGMTAEERWAFWRNEFSRCIKCYACRAACPMCYCTRCIVEDNRPQWIDPWASPLSNMEWQISRVMHLAGRCVGCGSCGHACPEGIPVHLLNRRLLENIRADFGVEPGSAPKDGVVLNTFNAAGDKESFIL